MTCQEQGRLIALMPVLKEEIDAGLEYAKDRGHFAPVLPVERKPPSEKKHGLSICLWNIRGYTFEIWQSPLNFLIVWLCELPLAQNLTL